MSKITAVFTHLKALNRTALIPFVTCGDPSLEITLAILHGLVESGADVIELGVPFSDPMADGPVIQRASERALQQGVSLAQVLQLVKLFRKTNHQTPIVLMGYANPIESYGYDRFADDAADVGVDGVLIVDYPPEEYAPLAAALTRRGVDRIFLIAPTTPVERIKLISKWASGYIYYVSLKGVTGSALFDLEDVAQRLLLIKETVTLPLGVGFGIRDPQSAAAVAKIADAVVIGSRLIEEIESAVADQQIPYNTQTIVTRVSTWLSSIRQALDDGMLSKN